MMLWSWLPQGKMMLWSWLPQGIILILCINSLGSHCAPVSASSTNHSDRIALLAFKDQIKEDPFGALRSWNDSLDYCKWLGVECSPRHPDRVVVLDLESQKLQGTLSPYIGNLSFLRQITLTNNSFNGDIPQELGFLLRLQVLSLNNNTFTGEIPTNLANCSNLRWINLIDNKLTGRVPSEVSSLKKLSVLALGGNKLIGRIPESLGNLSSLTQLSLSESTLEGTIPTNLCRLQSLIFLQLSSNNLTGTVPSCIYNLSLINSIDLSDNQLEGTITQDFGNNLFSLQEIYLGGNKFTGEIPLSLSNASRLELIALQSNHLTGQVPGDLGRLEHLRRILINKNQLGSKLGDDWNFITSLTNCSKLQWLSASINRLRGSLPNSVGNLSAQMTLLLLGTNQIQGDIPVEIENLVNLNVLYAPENYITGIPAGMGKMKSLNQIFLGQNRISGSIPVSLGNLTQLSYLNLSQNQLDGSVPPSLGNCRDLFSLDLSFNKLNGTIPKEVVSFSSLMTVFDLSHNALTGFLPVEVGNMSSLQMLVISENKLSGHIPDTLGNCLTLEKVDMKGNFFEGTIPKSLNILRGLGYLDLSHNRFSGVIPEYFGRFPLLVYLNLSFNEFEGQVPNYGVFGNSSSFSVRGNSKVCGGAVELKLPVCHFRTSKNHVKSVKSLLLKVVLPVIVASLCLLACLFLLYHQRRKLQREPSASSLNHRYLRVSYAELLKATNAFSSDNLIGVGSYGSVYKGVLDQINTVVAVKVLNLQQQGASKSFLSECNALRNLRHRNLLKIITSCSSLDFHGNDFKALVFELMPQGSLEEWLHPKVDIEDGIVNLNFLQKLNIAIDIASALEYLHHLCQPAIIHCDLKPSNVLLNDDLVAHVADFGLAKIFSAISNDSTQNQASTNVIRGSIGYVAPEYGMGVEASMQGDVYSYGILLLEMFTGKRPTDDMFQNGLSLHNFVEMALPKRVTENFDLRMAFGESSEAIKGKNEGDKSQECLVSAMKLGVICSASSPVERSTMKEVVAELLHIRDRYQTLPVHSE